MPKISIDIPTHNRQLLDTIDSVSRITPPIAA